MIRPLHEQNDLVGIMGAQNQKLILKGVHVLKTPSFRSEFFPVVVCHLDRFVQIFCLGLLFFLGSY